MAFSEINYKLLSTTRKNFYKGLDKHIFTTRARGFLVCHRNSCCFSCSFHRKRFVMTDNPPSKGGIKYPSNTEEQKDTKVHVRKCSTHHVDDAVVDVVVIGCGPAGLALSRSLSERNLRVVCIDPNVFKPWKNNYGVWVDRMENLQLADCLSPIWYKTRVHIDDNRTRLLPFAYGRVDRNRMKQRLLNTCKQNGVCFCEDSVENIVQNSSQHSVVTTSQQTKFTCRLVVDATGHSNTFVKFDEPHEPGFQVAYGIEAEVSKHPFPLDEMLLMDFRDSHMEENVQDKTQSLMFPTFLYAMPLSSNRIFLEETSLISRPPLSFEELKHRLSKRLAFYQIEIKNVVDEEFCLIPMVCK